MNAPASVRANADQLAKDAAALVRVASPNDWPGGFAVINDTLPTGIVALACGAGRGMAETYRLRPGVRAVLVDVSKRVANPAMPQPHERLWLERTALHEAAHTLTTHETTADHVDKLLATAGDDVPAYPAATVARQHCPRWAMAFWLLVNRAAGYRRNGVQLVHHAGMELGMYGYARGDLERLSAGVAPDAALGERLQAGGVWDTLLCSQLPSIEQRANAIVAAGVSRGEKEG